MFPKVLVFSRIVHNSVCISIYDDHTPHHPVDEEHVVPLHADELRHKQRALGWLVGKLLSIFRNIFIASISQKSVIIASVRALLFPKLF